MAKVKIRRKKMAPVETAPSKPTATFYSDQIIGSENLSVGSSVKVEIQGKVIDERINIYGKPQKKSFEIEVHKAKVID